MVAVTLVRRSVRVLAACLLLIVLAGCSREQRQVQQQLEGMPGVTSVAVSCGDDGALNRLGICATVLMSKGKVLRFVGLGYQSFGPVPSRVRLIEAGGRSPLIVSCDSRAVVADVDRSGLFGHHFSPPIDGIAAAIERHQDLIEEMEFWPQCPQFWELQEEQGPKYRYCAHAAGVVAEQPPPPCDHSLDKTK